jgi:hypothetical protein
MFLFTLIAYHKIKINSKKGTLEKNEGKVSESFTKFQVCEV